MITCSLSFYSTKMQTYVKLTYRRSPVDRSLRNSRVSLIIIFGIRGVYFNFFKVQRVEMPLKGPGKKVVLGEII